MAEMVVKSNALIQASYTLGLVEQRLILMAIVGARETGDGITAESLLTVRAQDYAELFGVERHTAYGALAGAVETLFNRRATVDVYDKKHDRTRSMTVRWVTAMAYEEGEGSITLRFGLEIVPELIRLESNFTSYELEQVAGLTSAYAVRLYELLMQWRVVGKTPVFKLAQFRGQLGLGVEEYASMGDFKKRVLDYGIKQINEKTDITVSYEQHKTGRNITGFSFKFKQKSGRKPPPKYAQQATQRDANTPDFFTQLTDKQIDLLVRSDLFLADFHQLYGASDDYAMARVKLRKKLIKSPEQFGKLDFDRYK
jgi:plasmid replication initiation protein